MIRQEPERESLAVRVIQRDVFSTTNELRGVFTLAAVRQAKPASGPSPGSRAARATETARSQIVRGRPGSAAGAPRSAKRRRRSRESCGGRPSAGGAPTAFITGSDGRFTSAAPGSDAGVPAGTYRLVVYWLDTPPSGGMPFDRLFGRYADPDRSTLTVTINPNDPDIGTLSLTSRPSR